MRKKSPSVIIILLSLLMAFCFLLSLLVGPAKISLTQTLNSLITGENEAIRLVVFEIRLPRAILGAMIGASLGLSGAVLQGYLRNPLADPGFLGISASAALGAVIAIYTGLSLVFPLALPLLALSGALCAVLLLKGLAGARGNVMTLILAGIAINSFAGAMTSLALNLSPNPFAAMEIVFWLLGSLADRSMTHVWLVAPFMIPGWLMLIGLGRSLDALSLGEETAMNLGVNLSRVQLLAILGTASAIGAATAVAGMIGFVGLIVPHILRPLVGASPSRLLLPSALGGATLLLLADSVVRLIDPNKDLKLGVITALIGAPFFLWLIIRTRRHYL